MKQADEGKDNEEFLGEEGADKKPVLKAQGGRKRPRSSKPGAISISWQSHRERRVGQSRRHRTTAGGAPSGDSRLRRP